MLWSQPPKIQGPQRCLLCQRESKCETPMVFSSKSDDTFKPERKQGITGFNCTINLCCCFQEEVFVILEGTSTNLPNATATVNVSALGACIQASVCDVNMLYPNKVILGSDQDGDVVRGYYSLGMC
jgi:hypothetical protein